LVVCMVAPSTECKTNLFMSFWGPVWHGFLTFLTLGYITIYGFLT
jgi:hypothetical protein